VNERSGYANVVSTSDGKFRVSLGSFPDPNIAEDLRRYYESLAVTESVQFTYQKSFMASGSGLSRIIIGPFSTRGEVFQALKQVRQDQSLASSFVIHK
jgi:cell division septation protein DedD